MKKFSVTLFLAMFFISVPFKVIAADYYEFYNEVVAIKSEYFSLEEKVDLKSFGFLTNILAVQIMDYELKMENVDTTDSYIREKQIARLVNRYYAIFEVQLFTLEKYLEYEVIAKSQNTERMKKMCQKLFEHIKKAEKALR